MNSEQRQALWQKIQGQLHPSTTPAAMPEDQTESNLWYVRLMLGGAAWIAAGFLLVFAFMAFTFLLDSPAGAAFLAAVVLALAYRLFCAKSDFAVQFGLALSIAGQALMLYSLREIHSDQPMLAYVILFAIELCLLYLPNFISRIVCTCAAWVALGFALHEIQLNLILPGLTAVGVLVWSRFELPTIRKANLITPIGQGLLLVLLICPSIPHSSDSDWFSSQILPKQLFNLGLLLPMLWLIWQETKNQALSLSSPAGLAVLLASLLFAPLAWLVPGLSVAALLFLLGFASGRLSLLALGTACFAWYLGRFYYDLEMTLVQKSQLLLVSGLLLMLARFILQKIFPLEQKHA